MQKTSHQKRLTGFSLVLIATLALFSTVQLFGDTANAREIDLLPKGCPTDGDACETNENCGNQALCYCNTFTKECGPLHNDDTIRVQ
ncbi:MAG: hypothetical protein AAF560_18515 [Acidobacteriota bacterium]